MEPQITSSSPDPNSVIDLNSTVLERLTPESVHYPRSRDFALQIEKRAILQDMLSLSEGMSEVEIDLIKASADIAFACHRDHFRSGETPSHYTRHLYEVARRFKENFIATGESFHTPFGEEISDLALGIAVSILHDSQEDIFKTYTVLVNRKESDQIVESHIREKFKNNLDSDSLNRLCGLITKLSIQNNLDICDSFYVRQIEIDKIAKQVKLADISHNIESLYKISPFSGAVVFPAQYEKFISGTSYEEEFYKGVCRSLTVDFSKIDLTLPSQGSYGKVIEKFLAIEGETAANRIDSFYKKLLERLENNPEGLVPEDWTFTELVENIKRGIKVFSAIGGHTQPTSVFPERDIEVDGITIGILGPVTAWTAEIKASVPLEVLHEAILLASRLSGQRISGFVVHNPDGSLSYNMSRWARRSGLEVSSMSDYETSARKIVEVLSENYSIKSVLEINSHAGEYSYSTLLGLEEGYFEGRKRNLISKEGIASGPELLRDFIEEVGDPEILGLDVSMFGHLSEAKEYLRSLSLAIVHTPAEVRTKIVNEAIEITPAYIYSVDPKSDYIYQEPAVLLRGPKDSNFLSNVSKIATAFHQARISVQYDSDIPEAYNFEFKEDLNNNAARMRRVAASYPTSIFSST